MKWAGDHSWINDSGFVATFEFGRFLSCRGKMREVGSTRELFGETWSPVELKPSYRKFGFLLDSRGLDGLHDD
jgi:hypothetical protein